MIQRGALCSTHHFEKVKCAKIPGEYSNPSGLSSRPISSGEGFYREAGARIPLNPKPMTDLSTQPENISRPLVLFGCGGHAREVAEIALHAKELALGPTILGFLDEDASRHGEQVDGIPVLGSFEWLQEHLDSVDLVVAIGHIPTRQRIAERSLTLGASFATVISPLATLSRHCRIGRGSMIFPQVVVSTNVTIGEHVILGVHSSVSHDCVIEDFAFLCPGSRATGGVTLGTGAMLGTNASILPGRSVGAGTLIGGGACVATNIGCGVTAVGVPAKVLPPRPKSPNR